MKTLLQYEVELLKKLTELNVNIKGNKEAILEIEKTLKEVVSVAEKEGFRRGLERAGKIIHDEVIKNSPRF